MSDIESLGKPQYSSSSLDACNKDKSQRHEPNQNILLSTLSFFGDASKSMKKSLSADMDKKGAALSHFGFDTADNDRSHQLQQYCGRPDINDNNQFILSSSIITQNAERDRETYCDVETQEAEVRTNAMKNPFLLFVLGFLASMKVLLLYLSKPGSYTHLLQVQLITLTHLTRSIFCIIILQLR
jgi:hypothetical protein